MRSERIFWHTFRGNRTARTALVAVYYLAILAGLILLYGRGDFSTPGFIYQGF